MHQHDCGGVDAPGAGLGQRRGDAGKVQRGFDLAIGADALGNLDHPLVKLFGKDDFLGENIGPRLIGDAQRVAETLGDQQNRPVALAFQQGVGRHRRAHAHRPDTRGVDFAAQQAADTFDGGILIGIGIFGQQFQRMQAAIRRTADHIGEGAAAIHPEIPTRVATLTLHPAIPFSGAPRHQ
jgi:hypothetical protein